MKSKRIITHGGVIRWIVGNYAHDSISAYLHREDGPAVEYPLTMDSSLRGRKFWWYKNKQVDVKTQEEFERWMRLKAFA
jgi:hypothetical protein